MKALRVIYVLVWLYIVYYSACMIYRVLGNDAIPLFVAIAILIAVRSALYYCLAKRWED